MYIYKKIMIIMCTGIRVLCDALKSLLRWSIDALSPENCHLNSTLHNKCCFFFCLISPPPSLSSSHQRYLRSICPFKITESLIAYIMWWAHRRLIFVSRFDDFKLKVNFGEKVAPRTHGTIQSPFKPPVHIIKSYILHCSVVHTNTSRNLAFV